MKTLSPFYLCTIDRNKLTPTEKLIVNEFASYLKGVDAEYPEGLHISQIHDDFRDNTKDQSNKPDNEYGFTEHQLLDFCNKFGIDTNWETNQIIKL